MSIKKSDMSQWYGLTRRCSDLSSAMEFALHELKRTSHVAIWPLGQQWLVVTFASALMN